MSDREQEWYIKCGELNGHMSASSAEQAFLKLVDDHDGGLALLFRATTTANGKKGRYYSSEEVLRSAGLLETTP